MTLTNLGKKATVRTSINYRVPLRDRYVPGKLEPLQGALRPAISGLADRNTPPF